MARALALDFHSIECIATEVNCLFHTEEHDDEEHSANDCAQVHGPAPSVRVVEPPCNKRGEEIGSEQDENVYAHVCPSIVGEEEIKTSDLGQGFDPRDDNPDQNPMRVPFSRGVRVCCPNHNRDSEEHGDKVNTTTAVRKGDRLPDETTPTEEKEHDTGSLDEVGSRNARVGRGVCQDGVLKRGSNAGAEYVQVRHAHCEQFASICPVEWILRVGARSRD